MRVVVTGAHGKVGRAATRALADAGHEVTAVDVTRPVWERAEPGAPAYRQADLTDAGEAFAVVRGAEAVVHGCCGRRRAAGSCWGRGWRRELVREYYGDSIPLRALSRPDASGISCAKAYRLLGWAPKRSWRDYLDENGHALPR
ncbi:NAD-dependent epimerase/dehydratase family protein [Nonomuraea pusilla]|uniref:NAD dependent epimerase/dehydratase family protein n=1 Tax=Nonomuraea pusilla TaxID=46177 RepID=A0A1H7L2N6_9ACTN|nr:NAD-dependent epimerase/dehydratase family protein [Nonomuraea pusilla]SEK93060.1 NAD dependent epimerase/dehydratase family protein [Nonomuraea pusilla]